MRHNLSDIDPETRTAFCAACERRVDLAIRSKDGDTIRWRCAEKKREIQRAFKARVYETPSFALTQADYEMLLADQGGVCAICGESPGESRFALDHCHKTRTLRGLLCRRCNLILGWSKDDPELLKRAAAYLL